MKKSLLEGIATLVGMIVGAGIFGIPYVVAQAGFITGIITIIVLGIAILILNLYLGEVVIRTKGNHQLTSYAEKYLGKTGKILMLITLMISVYGALIAYTLGEGQAFSAILGIDPTLISIIFLSIMCYFVYRGLNIIKKGEVILSAIILTILGFIVLSSLPSVSLANFTGFSLSKIFLPYGVIFFALIGSAAIPDLKEELKGNIKQFKKAIILGSVIPIICYLLFTIVVIGVTGTESTPIATIGLGNVIGTYMVYAGNLFAIVAMATSFLVMALALNWAYSLDYKIKWVYSLILVFIPTLIISLLNLATFIQVLSVSGAIAGGLEGILIILMHRKARKMGGDKKPIFTFKGNIILDILLIIIFILGVFFTFYWL